MIVVDLKYIKLTNFKQHESFELLLDTNQLVLIKGKNGTGKTTIFESVYTALYNRRPNGRPAASAIKQGAKTAEIELLLSINGVNHLIKRKIGKSSNFSILKEGELVAEGNSATTYIEELIPPYIVKLSLLQDVDIKTIISNLIDIDSYVKLVREKMMKIQSQLTNITHDIDYLSQEKQMKENMIQQRENEIKKMEETITFYQNQLDELEEISQEQVFELINKREQFQKNLSNLQRQKLVEYDTTIEKLQREYNDLNTQRSMLQSKKNEFSKILYLDNCPLCKQPVTQQHKDDISQTLQELDNDISSIGNSLNQVVQSINQNKDLKNKVYESQDIYFEALRISNLSEEDLSVDLNYLRQVLQKRQSLQNSILQVKSKIENEKNDTSIEKRIKEIELEVLEKEKSKTKLDELIKILEVFANTRMLKNVLASTSSELIQSTIKKKYSSLNEVIVTLDEKENLTIQAMNTNNTILPMEDLSRGEDVIAKLTLFSAIRDVISSRFRFNVLFLDEFLDSLDPDNIMFVLPFLQEISKYDKIFVITHNSYALETEIWDTVIDLDLKVTN